MSPPCLKPFKRSCSLRKSPPLIHISTYRRRKKGYRSYFIGKLPVLYCTVLYCTVLYCTVLYCTILYCAVLYCTVLYCSALFSCVYSLSFYLVCSTDPNSSLDPSPKHHSKPSLTLNLCCQAFELQFHSCDCEGYSREAENIRYCNNIDQACRSAD